MGSITDAEIELLREPAQIRYRRECAEFEAWRERAGIRLPTDRVAENLKEMSQEAFHLIKIIELELSGIRDGDGTGTASRWWKQGMQDIEGLFLKYRCLTDPGYEDLHRAEIDAICDMYEKRRAARTGGQSS